MSNQQLVDVDYLCSGCETRPFVNRSKRYFVSKIVFVSASVCFVRYLADRPDHFVSLKAGICDISGLLTLDKNYIRNITLAVERHRKKLSSLHIVNNNVSAVYVWLKD